MVEGFFRGKKNAYRECVHCPIQGTRALRYKAKRKHPMRCTVHQVLHKKLFLVFVSD